MKIRILKIAKADIKEIYDYIAKDNKEAAEKTIDILFDTFKKVADFPGMGMKPKNKYAFNTENKLLIHENYNIIYSVKESTLIIKRILHSAKNLKNIF